MSHLRSVQRLVPSTKGLLHQRVNQELIFLSLLVTALGSCLLVGVSGFLVVHAAMREAELQARSIEHDLVRSVTSYQPVEQVQRELQLKAASRGLHSAVLLGPGGRVIAANDNTMLGSSVFGLSWWTRLGENSSDLLTCLRPADAAAACHSVQPVNQFFGFIPAFGGERLVHIAPTPLAIEGRPDLGTRGLLVLELDLSPVTQRWSRWIALVFLAGFAPLFLTETALVFFLRRRLLPELLGLAQVDSLSGVFNRRSFFEMAAQQIGQFNQNHCLCVVALIDIDRFKSINDTYGHPAGDEVICQLSTLFRDVIPSGDLIGRLGGDEFAVLMLESAEEAAAVLESLRRQVAARSWRLNDGSLVQFTLSIGMADSRLSRVCNIDELLAAADVGLYAAKGNGGNNLVPPNEAGTQGWTMQLA